MANARAQALARELAARRMAGQRLRRRKRLPRQIFPKGVQRDYARELVTLVGKFREESQVLFDALPMLVQSAQADRIRLDAGEGQRFSALIGELKEKLSFTFNPAVLERMAARYAAATSAAQRRELSKQVKAALGLEVLASDEGVIAAAELFTAENVGLITNIPAKTLAEIEGVVHRGLREGKLYGDLAKELEERFSFAKARAKLIARDQIGKYYGDVNRVRQTAMGVERYVWRMVNDQRVRRHHINREGEIFSWDKPPFDGHPGQPVQCRCYPEPIFDL